MVIAMKYGLNAPKWWYVNLANMCPSLKKDYDIPGVLPLKDIVFDRPALMQRYKELVRPDEDYDEDRNKGQYLINDHFTMVITSDMSDECCDDAIVQMKLDQIDHIEDFYKIYILPNDE